MVISSNGLSARNDIHDINYGLIEDNGLTFFQLIFIDSSNNKEGFRLSNITSSIYRNAELIVTTKNSDSVTTIVFSLIKSINPLDLIFYQPTTNSEIDSRIKYIINLSDTNNENFTRRIATNGGWAKIQNNIIEALSVIIPPSSKVKINTNFHQATSDKLLETEQFATLIDYIPFDLPLPDSTKCPSILNIEYQTEDNIRNRQTSIIRFNSCTTIGYVYDYGIQVVYSTTSTINPDFLEKNTVKSFFISKV